MKARSISPIRYYDAILSRKDLLSTILNDPLVRFFCQDALFMDRLMLRNVIHIWCHLAPASVKLGVESFFAVVYLLLQLFESNAWFTQSLVYWLFGAPSKTQRVGWLQSVMMFAALKDRIFDHTCTIPMLTEADKSTFDATLKKAVPTSWYFSDVIISEARPSSPTLELLESFDTKPPKPKELISRTFRSEVTGPLISRLSDASTAVDPVPVIEKKSLPYKRRMSQLGLSGGAPPAKRVPPPDCSTPFLAMASVYDICLTAAGGEAHG